MKMPLSVRIVIRAALQFSKNGGTQMGAALAYYALFSTAPLLLLAVMLAGLVFSKETAVGQVQTLLTHVGLSAAELPGDHDLDGGHAPRPRGGVLAAALGIGIFWFWVPSASFFTSQPAFASSGGCRRCTQQPRRGLV